MHRLSYLISRLQSEDLLRETSDGLDKNQLIDHLAHDSRKVGHEGLFVAIRGSTSDGHLFIDKAVKNGAVAIVCERMPGDLSQYSGISFVRVSNSRKALAALSAAFYNDPSRFLKVVGVTGTNGKTTTTIVLHNALTRLGKRTGLIGTVETRIADRTLAVTHTTPDSVELQGLVRKMVDDHCSHLAIEISSHALDQWRVHGLDCDVAVFTNLSRDHLDYHNSIEEYRDAKRKLFLTLKEESVAVVNADDPVSREMVRGTRARMLTYGFSPASDIHIEILSNDLDGLKLRIDGARRSFRLVGRFNAYNLGAAYAACRALGLGRDESLDAIAAAPPVRGRFEQLTFPDGTTVIIDYAHTPDALENVLRTIRETRQPEQQIWCVFGCGGNRDVSKRRMMGAIAEQYADRVIVTSDNPRNEEPEAIVNDIRRGMSRPTEAASIVNRGKAIEWAARSAAPGDIVLIAGKGHETYQIIGNEKHPFDDREEALRSFSHRTKASSIDH